MKNEIKGNLDALSNDEIIGRIASDYFTDEAKSIAIQLLKERGLDGIEDKIQASKTNSDQEAYSKNANRARFKRLTILLSILIFSVLTTAPINHVPVIMIGLLLFLMPLMITLWKGVGYFKVVVIIFAAMAVEIVGYLISYSYSFGLLRGIYLAGWLYAMYFSIKLKKST